MFGKSDVNGEHTNEVWRYLRRNSSLHNQKNGNTKVIPWNFTKFIVHTNFADMEYLTPRTEMKDIKRQIEGLLSK